MTRTLAARALGSLAVVAGLLVTLTGCGMGSAASLTRVTGSRMAHCKYAGSAADWHRMQTSIIQFGLDDVVLHDVRSPVTVVGASLIEPVGGIRLAKVGFGWLGRVDEAVTWRAAPDVAVSQRSLPAVLAYLKPPSGPLSKLDGRVWQLAVGLQTTSGTGGAASGVQITYISGGQTHTIRGQDPVGLYRDEADCQARVTLR